MPRRFRDRHGGEMLRHHVEARRGSARGPGFWLPLAWDVTVTGIQVRMSGRTQGNQGPTATARPQRSLAAGARYARHGARVLRKSPAFTVTAVVTLGLGIGANTALYSVVQGVLVRPLPYPAYDRLVWVAASNMSPANLAEWRQAVPSFERLEAFALTSITRRGPEGTRRLLGMIVTPGFLELLGASPVRGRLWSPDEGAPSRPPVAVVSRRLWQERFGSGDAAGRVVRLEDTPYTVVGVLPADFDPLGYEDVDVWVPVGQHPARGLNAVGLLAPGKTLAAARTEADALVSRLEVSATARDLGRFANLNSLREVFTGDVRSPLLVLFGAAGLVLLLACANIANLSLARATGRTREMAIRAALGADRRSLLAQLLVESALLALAGAALGLALAWGIVHRIAEIAPPWYFGRAVLDGVRIDLPVVSYTLAAATLTLLLAGVAPAFAVARAGDRALAPGGRVTDPATSHRWREGLVAAQVALAFVLLVGTALLVRTWLVLRPADPGFETRDRIVAELHLPGDDAGADRELVGDLLREPALSGPGVEAAAVTDVPLSGMISTALVVAVDGEAVPEADGRSPSIDLRPATPGYLDVVSMRMIAGRPLRDDDGPDAPFALVVNESAARRLWPDGASPVGRRVTLDLYGPTADFTVVGVVADAWSVGGTTRPRAEAFASWWQVPRSRIHLVVHAPPGSGVDGATLRRTVTALDPSIPVEDVTTLEAIAGASVARQRFQALLMSAFGLLALILAVIGCYGVLAHAVGQRTREIGVRKALGARPGVITFRVVRRGAVPVAAGLAAGAVVALGATRVLESALYGVSPADPTSFAVSALVLGGVSLTAAWLPARRAARVSPVTSLAAE